MKLNIILFIFIIISVQSCQKINLGEENSIPIVKMLPVTNSSSGELKFKVDVIQKGSEQIIKAGFVWAPRLTEEYLEDIALKEEDGIFIEIETLKNGINEAILNKYIQKDGDYNVRFIAELLDGTKVTSNVIDFSLSELDTYPWGSFDLLLNSNFLSESFNCFYDPSNNNFHVQLKSSGLGYVYDINQESWEKGIDDHYILPEILPFPLFYLENKNFFVSSESIFTFDSEERVFDLLTEINTPFDKLHYSFEKDGIGYLALDYKLYSFTPNDNAISFVADIPFLNEDASFNNYEVFKLDNKVFIIFKNQAISGQPIELWEFDDSTSNFLKQSNAPFSTIHDKFSLINLQNRAFIITERNNFWEYLSEEDRWLFLGWGDLTLRSANENQFFNSNRSTTPICSGQKCYFISIHKTFDLSLLPE